MSDIVEVVIMEFRVYKVLIVESLIEELKFRPQ